MKLWLIDINKSLYMHTSHTQEVACREDGTHMFLKKWWNVSMTC